MKIAVIGSRNIKNIDLTNFIPKNTTEIISGGAVGVDSLAREYAIANGIKLTEIKPEYNLYKKGAPLKRNLKIIQNSELVLAFWDGKSRGTKFVIDTCHRLEIPVRVYIR